MMTKLLSLVLSFSIIFMSIAPSYAQVRAADENAKRRQYDVMRMEDCERDASGNIKEIDFTDSQYQDSFNRMISDPDAWEWGVCSYVAGLKAYYENHPREQEALTFWQINKVFYAAAEKFIQRWNIDFSAHENTTFRNLMEELNAVVLRGKKSTPQYSFDEKEKKYVRVSSKVEEAVEEARRAGTEGSMFGLPGGQVTIAAAYVDLMREVTSVYKLLTEEPTEGASSDISYEEFAQLYKNNVQYEFSGRMAEEAKKHQKDPGWADYVAQLNRQLADFLSDSAVRNAYNEFLAQADEGKEEFQAVMQEYLKGLSEEIWAAYENSPEAWLGVLQDVFPLLNMYGGLPANLRKKAAAVMRSEISKTKSVCAKPGFFSMRTLKGLGVMLTLHQSQGAKDFIIADIVKANGQCAYAVKAAVALGALGEEGDNTADSLAVQDLFKEGFNGSAAAMVIPTSLAVLTAMGAYEDAADMIVHAGKYSSIMEAISFMFGAFSINGWRELFHTADSYWGEGANLEYSYYQDEHGEDRNVWVDTADLLMEAYEDADEEEQKKMNVLFRKSMEGLLEPSEKKLGMALRPFLAGIFSYGLIHIKLSEKDKGYSAFNQLEVLVDLNKITDTEGKKGAKEMFRSAYKNGIPYANVIIWYLFLSTKNDLHPKMRLYLNERLAQGMRNTGGNWADYAEEELAKQEAELQNDIKDFQEWTKTTENLTPLDDLIGIFFLWKGGKGVFSLLKFIGRTAGTATTSVFKMLRMMRSVNIVKVAKLGRNLNKVLKTGLTNFKSGAFRRLKMRAFTRIKGSPEIPSFKPGAAPGPKGVTDAAAASAPASELAAAPVGAETRVLNGQLYIVPAGTETVYVRGMVQFIPKGKSLSSVARDFNVPIEDVAWATNGSSWAGIQAFSLNYGAGEAVAGSRGVQPLMARPEIRVPQPVSRVTPPASSPVSSSAAARPSASVQASSYSPKVWHISDWEWFKADMKVRWNEFVTGLTRFGRLSVQSPFRTAGVGASMFSMGGVLPAETAFVVEAPSLVRSFSSYNWLGAASDASSVTRSVAGESASSAVAPSASALEVTAATANSGIYGGKMFLNPFWLFGAATSPHITPIGAIGSLDERRNYVYSGYLRKDWSSPAAFTQYQQQLNNWMYRSNPLYRAQNPWMLGHWWDDVTTSMSLGWQEFNLSRAGNPNYAMSLAEQESARQQNTSLHSAEGNNPLAAPSTQTADAGHLYSGLPVFAMAKWGKRAFNKIINYFSREQNLPKENAEPGQFNTVHTEDGKVSYRYRSVAYKDGKVRMLAQGEETPEGWNVYLLAETYNFMPVATDEKAMHANTLATLILRDDSPVRQDLVFILASGANQVYKVQAFNKLRQLKYSMPTEAEVIEFSHEINDGVGGVLSRADALDIEASMQRVVNEGGNAAQMAGPEHHVLLEGVSEEALLNINKNKVSAALYNVSEIDRFLGQMQVSTTRNGHTKYSGLLPIYLRLSNRSLSDTPRLYFVLNKGQTFLVPRGFVLAMDEKGQMKFVVKDSEASIENSSRSLFKFLDKSIRLLHKPTEKRGHVVFEQPLALAELAGLAHVLEADVKESKVGVVEVRQQDSFESLMLVIALVAGADLGASMAGEFKTMFDWASAAIFISGFGYLSPKIANIFNPLISKYGYYQTVKAVLLTMVGISLLGVSAGLTGTFSFKEAGLFGEITSYVFAPVAILMASILSTIASPIMKSAYKDPTQYAAKNMGFTTMKGLSRAIVTLLPWVVGMGIMLGAALAPEGSALSEVTLNWSLLVPVMLVGSLYGLHLLQKSRLATEASEVKTSPISKKEAKQIYKQLFKPSLASTVARVALVYFTYAAINSVIFSGEMKMLYPAYGLAITATGLAMSFAVRKLADRMIKNKVITDDQLTGIGLPLMLFGVLMYVASPAGSLGMWLSWLSMYLSTPVFGVVENSRMMNQVGRYYAAERDRIRKDKQMTAQEKKQATDLLKKTEEAVKLQAAGAYNSANSSGLFPILLLTGLFLLLKDLPSVADVAQPLMDVINNFFGDPSVTAKGEPLNDYAIYRLGAVLSIFTASLLVWQNWDMVKDGWSRLFRSTSLSQQQIDAYERGDLSAQQVYNSLGFNSDAMASTLQRVTKEVEELQISVRGSMRAFESESRLQKLMNRMVWVNNRLKALAEGSKVPVAQLASSLQMLRSTAIMFRTVVEFNDVSEGLRAQAADFFQSVESISFNEDKDMEALSEKLKSYAGQVQNSKALSDGIFQLEESYLFGDLKRFALHYSSLKKMLKGLGADKELDKLYQSVVGIMESGAYSVQDMSLEFLPEVKMSLVAHIPGLSKAAKSIFDGTNVSDYERVKVGYLRTLNILLEEKQNGMLYDGMNGDFALYYQKAVETLDRYAASTDDAARVQNLRKELDDVYTAYMGEAPTETSVAAQAAQNSGLWGRLTNWWNEFIGWLKGGDSSDNSGPAVPADGPDPE
ncbi:MAG: hypothetical protein ACI351_00695 [Candidatus Avelusimicrobium sp.]|uniref:hypothetical protein n=1 Tax=Candidatus Avelusimicrobium sp. TaxID=3048833 RepID=UPI003F11EC13